MSSISPIIRLHIWLQRAVRWEFWPWRIVYLPVAVYWFFLSIRARGWVFFSAANPSMRFGGFVAYSKSKVNKLVPEKYVPRTVYLSATDSIEEALRTIQESQMAFPIIVKPDVGERGWGVRIVRTEADLLEDLNTPCGNKLVQEYVDQPMEVGVMYSRHPDEKTGIISSVVIKEFPTVVGDGHRTLQQLLLDDIRSRLSYHIHEKRFKDRLSEIPEAGKKVQVVHIGNHMLGTTFYNGNHLIDAQLTLMFDKLAKQISGFFIGRFDVRTSSIDNLKAGNFYVIEVNGVNSEPCHIFHPGRSIFLAWRDLFKHWKRIAEISIANHQKGVPYASYAEIRAEIKRHGQELKTQL